MKKIVSTISLVCGLTAYANAQGTFIIDSGVNANNGSTPTSTTGGRIFINGVLDTLTDINLEVLWGTAANSVNTVLDIATPSGGNGAPYGGNINWIASQPTGSTDITFNGNGTLVDPNGNNYVIPTIAAAGTVFLNILAWTGSSGSFAAAANSGQSGVFSIVLASSLSPSQPDISSMGSINITAVPEPATLALAGLGGLASLVMLRRKQA